MKSKSTKAATKKKKDMKPPKKGKPVGTPITNKGEVQRKKVLKARAKKKRGY